MSEQTQLADAAGPETTGGRDSAKDSALPLSSADPVFGEEAITAAVSTSQVAEGVTGTGELIPSAKQLKEAVEQYFKRTVQLHKNRYKAAPKRTQAQSDEVFAKGLTVKAEAAMLELSEARVHQMRADYRRRNAPQK